MSKTTCYGRRRLVYVETKTHKKQNKNSGDRCNTVTNQTSMDSPIVAGDINNVA